MRHQMVSSSLSVNTVLYDAVGAVLPSQYIVFFYLRVDAALVAALLGIITESVGESFSVSTAPLSPPLPSLSLPLSRILTEQCVRVHARRRLCRYKLHQTQTDRVYRTAQPATYSIQQTDCEACQH